jgi:HSP20 family protein
MSSLVRWSPGRDSLTVRDVMDQLFADSFVRMAGWTAPASMADLAMDVYETKDDVVVKAALPGVKPEEVEITITGSTLAIRGESKVENEIKGSDYVRKERRYGSFARTVTLPEGLRSDKADASFENGMLTLRLPKSEEKKPKTIKVKPVI